MSPKRLQSLMRTVVVVMGVALAACGGGESSSSPSAAAPPASQPVAPEPNRAPVRKDNLQITSVPVFHAVDLDASRGGAAFIDPDGDPLTYTLTWDGPVPTGLSFSGSRVVGATSELGEFRVGLTVSDGRGGQTLNGFILNVIPNTAPPVARANPVVLSRAGEVVDIDTLQAGATFGPDPEGDPLTYSVSLPGGAKGLTVNGSRVVGVMSGVGAVRVRVTAADPFGATNFDEFVVAVPAAEPGAPVLPTTPYVYEDDKLPLYGSFKIHPGTLSNLWDTTPKDNSISDAGATLGRVLFYDKRLSSTNTHSCGSCHHQERGFADGRRFSEGATGELSRRNAMGLTEVRYNEQNTFFSDARVRTLEKLALMPIQDTTELANTLPNLITKLESTSFYPGLFSAAFGTPEITQDRIAKAIAQFLRSLISYNSKFDEHRRTFTGVSVLSPQEQAGAMVAHNHACISCHNTEVQQQSMPMINGLDAVITDVGAGRGAFRAASLRNIAKTAPYMHDGRFTTLREVIDHYDHGVQPTPFLPSAFRDGDSIKRLNLTEDQKVALEAFLNTLTDEAFLTDPRFSDPFQ